MLIAANTDYIQATIELFGTIITLVLGMIFLSLRELSVKVKKLVHYDSGFGIDFAGRRRMVYL